jgi:predicted phage terminase large subunit-like protein
MSVKPQLKSRHINAFVQAFLLETLDEPCPTPKFHWEMWDMVCSEHTHVAIAAPRNHAKTSSVTNAVVLAHALMGINDFFLIVSETWAKAKKFLSSISTTLKDNAELRKEYGPITFEKDTEEEIIVNCAVGKFCIIIRGAEQNMRGAMWGTKRPNFVIADDIENDQCVNSPERRTKFREDFQNILLCCGSLSCRYRVIGTILHYDSLLENLMSDTMWRTKRYRAHEGIDDFSNILWPERWTEKALRDVRQRFANMHNLDGYSQEYLNIPMSTEDQYLRPEDMLPMGEEELKDHAKGKMSYYAAADLAISRKTRADYTVIGVMGVTSKNFRCIVDVRRIKKDSLGIIRELLSVQERYKPEIFGIEKGQIKETIGPFLSEEMRKTGVYINIEPLSPAGDKPSRGRSFQAMHRAGSIKFDKDASWYMTLEDELLKMSDSGMKGGHDDQFDVMAYLGMMVDQIVKPNSEEEEYEDEMDRYRKAEVKSNGRSLITGY